MLKRCFSLTMTLALLLGTSGGFQEALAQQVRLGASPATGSTALPGVAPQGPEGVSSVGSLSTELTLSAPALEVPPALGNLAGPEAAPAAANLSAQMALPGVQAAGPSAETASLPLAAERTLSVGLPAAASVAEGRSEAVPAREQSPMGDLRQTGEELREAQSPAEVTGAVDRLYGDRSRSRAITGGTGDFAAADAADSGFHFPEPTRHLEAARAAAGRPDAQLIAASANFMNKSQVWGYTFYSRATNEFIDVTANFLGQTKVTHVYPARDLRVSAPIDFAKFVSLAQAQAATRGEGFVPLGVSIGRNIHGKAQFAFWGMADRKVRVDAETGAVEGQAPPAAAKALGFQQSIRAPSTGRIPYTPGRVVLQVPRKGFAKDTKTKLKAFVKGLGYKYVDHHPTNFGFRVVIQVPEGQEEAIAARLSAEHSKQIESAQPEYLYYAQKPEPARSGLAWDTKHVEAFIKEHGDAIRAVPGVQGVEVSYGFAGTALPFLTITVDKSKTIEEVQQAVEAAVPAVQDLKGVLGAPNQLWFKHPGRVLSVAAASWEPRAMGLRIEPSNEQRAMGFPGIRPPIGGRIDHTPEHVVLQLHGEAFKGKSPERRIKNFVKKLGYELVVQHPTNFGYRVVIRVPRGEEAGIAVRLREKYPKQIEYADVEHLYYIQSPRAQVDGPRTLAAAAVAHSGAESQPASIGFGDKLRADRRQLLSGALEKGSAEVAEFLRAQGWEGARYWLVTSAKDLSPGVATVVRAVSYRISVYANQFAANLALGEFEVEIDIRTGAITKLSRVGSEQEDEPVGAIAPWHVQAWEKQVGEQLRSQHVDFASVQLYADAPSRVIGGPNVISVRLRVPARPTNAQANPYIRARQAHEALQKAAEALPWMAQYTWEISLPKGKTYRNGIPYPGEALPAEAAREILRMLKKEKLLAYGRPAGVPPFEGAYTVERLAADDAGMLSMLGDNGWVLHDRSGSRPNQGAFKPSAEDYFLVWNGAVAQALKAEAAPAGLAAEMRFDGFAVNGIQVQRDGGTILLAGQWNKSVSAVIRYDGAQGSPTKGRLFVQYARAPKAEAERPMTEGELSSLRNRLAWLLNNEPNSVKDIGLAQQLLAHIAQQLPLPTGGLAPAAITPAQVTFKDNVAEALRESLVKALGANPYPVADFLRQNYGVSPEEFEKVSFRAYDAIALGTEADAPRDYPVQVTVPSGYRGDFSAVVDKDGKVSLFTYAPGVLSLALDPGAFSSPERARQFVAETLGLSVVTAYVHRNIIVRVKVPWGQEKAKAAELLAQHKGVVLAADVTPYIRHAGPAKASEAQPVSPAEASPGRDFSTFFPNDISKKRDGGTIVMAGDLNKTLSAVVRYDGKTDSPTRGRIFVGYASPKARYAERVMTEGELRSLKARLEDLLKRRSRWDTRKLRLYQELLRHIEEQFAASPNDGPLLVGALPPGVEKGWAKQLKTYLAGKGIPTEVGWGHETPLGWMSGSNIVTIRIKADRRPNQRRLPGERQVFNLLKEVEGKPEFAWLSGKVWEIGIEGGQAHRSAIPFPGQALSKQAAKETLDRLGGEAIRTYEPAPGVAPFDGAWAFDSAAANDPAIRAGLEEGNWELHQRPGGLPPMPGFPVPAQNLYLVWKGAVAQTLGSSEQTPAAARQARVPEPSFEDGVQPSYRAPLVEAFAARGEEVTGFLAGQLRVRPEQMTHVAFRVYDALAASPGTAGAVRSYFYHIALYSTNAPDPLRQPPMGAFTAEVDARSGALTLRSPRSLLGELKAEAGARGIEAAPRLGQSGPPQLFVRFRSEDDFKKVRDLFLENSSGRFFYKGYPIAINWPGGNPNPTDDQRRGREISQYIESHRSDITGITGVKSFNTWVGGEIGGATKYYLGVTRDASVPAEQIRAALLEKLPRLAEYGVELSFRVDEPHRIEPDHGVPPWLDLPSLKVTQASERPGIGGSNITIVLQDKGNNTVTLTKPSPEPPVIDRPLTARFSPILHVYAVESHDINGPSAQRFIRILREVQGRPEYGELAPEGKAAVESFLRELERRFPATQSPASVPGSNQDFSAFHPYDIAAKLDGGTLILTGRLGDNKQFTVNVRHDGKLGSPLRGLIWSSFTAGNGQPVGHERVMNKQELLGLQTALGEFLRKVRLIKEKRQIYTAFQERVSELAALDSKAEQARLRAILDRHMAEIYLPGVNSVGVGIDLTIGRDWPLIIVRLDGSVPEETVRAAVAKALANEPARYLVETRGPIHEQEDAQSADSHASFPEPQPAPRSSGGLAQGRLRVFLKPDAFPGEEWQALVRKFLSGLGLQAESIYKLKEQIVASVTGVPEGQEMRLAFALPQSHPDQIARAEQIPILRPLRAQAAAPRTAAGQAVAAVGAHQERLASVTHREMIQKLKEGGLTHEQILADAMDLRKPGVEAALEAKGWKAEKAHAGYRAIYSVGDARIYLNGQRAVFAEDGTIHLLSFSGVFVQVIAIDKDGQVTSNQVTKLDSHAALLAIPDVLGFDDELSPGARGLALAAALAPKTAPGQFHVSKIVLEREIQAVLEARQRWGSEDKATARQWADLMKERTEIYRGEGRAPSPAAKEATLFILEQIDRIWGAWGRFSTVTYPDLRDKGVVEQVFRLEEDVRVAGGKGASLEKLKEIAKRRADEAVENLPRTSLEELLRP